MPDVLKSDFDRLIATYDQIDATNAELRKRTAQILEQILLRVQALEEELRGVIALMAEDQSSDHAG